MQVLLLGLFVLIYMHDASTLVEVVRGGEVVGFAEALPGDVWPGLGPGPVLLLVLLPKLLVVLVYGLVCRRTYQRLGTRGGQRTLNWLEAITGALPFLLLTLFAADLLVGYLRVLRVPFRNTVLADEALAMLPTLLVPVLAWWAYYPVDRRLREAAIMRDADIGRPVYPLLSRGGYLVMQLRHQFGLLLLPLLAVFAWSEAIVLLGPDGRGLISAQAASVLSPAGILIVFVGAPLAIRYVWQTAPLPAGEVRDRMVELCEQHRVRVRELLVWQTSGRLINAAVTGLVRQVRYILLSDGLLDQLSPEEIEAVMAHELAHVKCKHIVWMGLVVVTTLSTMELLVNAAVDRLLIPTLGNVRIAMIHAETGIHLYDPEVRLLLAAIPSFIITLLAFGWVSRRIERQADVFAVKHLASNSKDNTVFDERSVKTMVHALQRVAELNHAPIHRKSWRHGSIAWRQDYLRSLVGKPLGRTAVDRTLNHVKLATLIAIALWVAAYLS